MGTTYLLTINLTTVHVFHSDFGFVGRGIFHISIAPIGSMQSVNWYVNMLDDTIECEYLGDVVLGDVSRQPADMNANRFWCCGTFALLSSL